MKKVLLIGDSIRMSYNARVAELLSGKAVLWGPDDNCRFAKYTQWCIGEWMNNPAIKSPDIIHWNNGIWDTFKAGGVEPFVELDEYLRTMECIYNEMRKSGALIIFATTTPVGIGFASDNNDRIDRYNAAIRTLFESKNVPVNDLNAVIKPHLNEYLSDDLLHLNADGVEAASQAVAAFIGKYL